MRNSLKIFLLITLFSCQIKESKQKIGTSKEIDEVEEIDYSLIGKKGILTFPKAKAYVSYPSENRLEWRTIDNNGNETSGSEVLFYKRLNDHIHFLNFIEIDGFTVSQIINTKDKTVKSFWSYHDEESDRGKRSSSFVDGKFEFDL
ncbi:MoaF-related domain-containing protein [Maribacter sp. X9]|uniref:MoaF-related domain-containing protein n=1 Tax=Maribacter sp. X9 TaxID=3402159 RepID=UPI003AF3FBF4